MVLLCSGKDDQANIIEVFSCAYHKIPRAEESWVCDHSVHRGLVIVTPTQHYPSDAASQPYLVRHGYVVLSPLFSSIFWWEIISLDIHAGCSGI